MNSSLDNINNTGSIPAGFTSPDIMTVVNNERWTNASIHKLNITDADFKIFSRNNFSDLTCTYCQRG